MIVRVCLFSALALSFAFLLAAQTNSSPNKPLGAKSKPQAAAAAKASPAELARGKYLVEGAGQCQDCHTPRNQRGEFVRSQWLQGSPIMFRPTVPMPQFVTAAPPIAGLPGWSEADAVKFLMTGVDPQGGMRRPPMPEFRFNRADASSIVKYLKSLEK